MDTPFGFSLTLVLFLGLLALLAGALRLSQARRDRRLMRFLEAALAGPTSQRPSMRLA
jgi:hypothetical protein